MTTGRLRKCGVVAAGLLCGVGGLGQSAPGKPEEAVPAIRSSSTLVIVPAVVRSAGGDLVHGLGAGDFRVTDDGVEQKVRVEELASQPISLVVLMQTGGAASRQFPSYAGVGTMVESMTGCSAYRVAMVTFDSRPEEMWDFTTAAGELRNGFQHPVAGDGGAAIVDAVDYGIGLLRKEPTGSRRVLLLLSQTRDAGSKTPVDAVVRRLGESNIAIYTLAFSPETTWLKDQFTQPRRENAPYTLSPDHAPLLHTFDLGTPLMMAIDAMRTDMAAEIAALSGGESRRFGSKGELERQMGELANHLANRYTLSFQPSVARAGFHALRVEVRRVPGAVVSARTGYWATGP